MLLQDRVALVSGIGPGLGGELALTLARHGAHVALAARSAAHLEPVARQVESLGRRALAVETDITSVDACRALVAKTCDAFGRIDVLVNNAYHPGQYELFERSRLADWRAPIEVNLFGTLQLTQAVVPVMRAAGGGSVVMINSMIVRNVLPTMGSYAASKGALLAATQGLARELGRHAIRVNSVVPGYIWGPNLESYFKAQASQRGVDPQVVYA
ncbi:MAG: SDR family NAD(P)-dependent oxidoreductase, partial [Deltaproteobacteria bacterium]|nr:SDR family NAD(P)-dependent oxidoreductase [Deltaproteobacteria bacterium]